MCWKLIDVCWQSRSLFLFVITSVLVFFGGTISNLFLLFLCVWFCFLVYCIFFPKELLLLCNFYLFTKGIIIISVFFFSRSPWQMLTQTGNIGWVGSKRKILKIMLFQIAWLEIYAFSYPSCILCHAMSISWPTVNQEGFDYVFILLLFFFCCRWAPKCIWTNNVVHQNSLPSLRTLAKCAWRVAWQVLITQSI